MEILPKDLISFFKKGRELNGILINQEATSVIDLLGEPLETIGDKNVGYYTFHNGFRVGYFKGEVDEIGIIFYGNEGIRLPLSVVGLAEISSISEETRIHTFIQILNYSGIAWKSFDEGNRNVFCIRTEGGVGILFDLETGRISKISFER